MHYLRTLGDAQRLSGALGSSRSITIVGAGLIGLEVAAAARQLGLSVVVVEANQTILEGSCPEPLARMILNEHKARGVTVELGCRIENAVLAQDQVWLETSKGNLLSDLIVVGVGVHPNVQLAENAGLATDDGILVDEMCHTLDPRIFAAGDVARFKTRRGYIRLENWNHAQDQGRVAGINAAGGHERYDPVPSFWFHQYDLNIQGVGWAIENVDQVVRHISNDRVLIFDIADNRIVRASGCNIQCEIGAVRRLIERGIAISAITLADPRVSLQSLSRST